MTTLVPPRLGRGAAAAGLFVAFIVAATVTFIVTPPPPMVGAAATLAYIAEHRTLYTIHQQLWLAPGLFAMVVLFYALYTYAIYLFASTSSRQSTPDPLTPTCPSW